MVKLKTVDIYCKKEEDDDEEYEVEKIIRMKTKLVSGKKYKFFLLKWVGYRELTWEPLSNLTHCKELLREFYKKRKIYKNKKKKKMIFILKKKLNFENHLV